MSNLPDLSNKVALITGASRGIGAAVAQAYARAGAHVVLLARTQGALEELDDAIQAEGGTATLLPMDLSRNLDKLDKLGPSLLERFGGLDIFVGNAGMLGPLSPMHQVKPKEWEKVMTTNVYANVRLIQTLDPLVRASKAGRMIFTGSGTAGRPKAYWGPYRTSKAALHMMVQTYAQEVVQTAMKVNVVDPGAIETKLLGEAYPGGYQQDDINTIDDVVPLYLELASEACSRHGEVISV